MIVYFTSNFFQALSECFKSSDDVKPQNISSNMDPEEESHVDHPNQSCLSITKTTDEKHIDEEGTKKDDVVEHFGN